MLAAVDHEGTYLSANLFQLPGEILNPILEKQAYNLFQTFENNFNKKSFTKTLFEYLKTCEPAVAVSVLTKDFIKAIWVTSSTTFLIREKLFAEFELEVLNNINLDKKVLLDIAYNNSSMDYSLWEKLCKVSQIGDLELEVQKTKNLTPLKNNQPLIKNLHESEINKLPTAIKLFLSKSYRQISNEEQKELFLNDLVKMLVKVVESQDVIATIIKSATENEEDIFFADKILVNSIESCGSYSMGDKNICVSLNFCQSDIIKNIVHESTHKFIDNKFNNNCLPCDAQETEFLKLRV